MCIRDSDNISKNIFKIRNESIELLKFKNHHSVHDDISQMNTDNMPTFLEHVTSQQYSNKKVIELFCDLFVSKTFMGYTFIAHYAKGSDNQPILNWVIHNNIVPSTITIGNKISLINIKEFKIRFIDSINFTLCPLAAFPKTFGFEGNKGNFPHYFNKEKNQKYIGKFPDLKYFGYHEMSDKNSKKEELKI